MQHLETFLDILNAPPPFEGLFEEEDRDSCERLLSEFSGAEIEELANVSYAYWLVKLRANDNLPENAQRNSALKEIRRHYVGEYRKYEKALTVIREALEYRREYRMDILRSCCYDDFDYINIEDAHLARKYRSYILQDLERQMLVVRGVDAHGRTIIYKPHRNAAEPTDHDEEAFIITQIYAAERAMATTEFSSKGKEEKLTVVFNFRDYDRNNSPAISSFVTLTKISQRCYPERLGVLVIMDPPFWMRATFNIVWPLLSKAVSEKIKLPYGEKAIEKEFRNLVDEDNKELERMLSTGDIASVDVSEYTSQPFYAQFQQK